MQRSKPARTNGMARTRDLFIAVALLCAAVWPHVALPQGVVSLDKIVAIVDDDVILKSEFDMRWTQIEAQLANIQGPRPDVNELKQQLLDQLIIENLQYQMASRAGVRIDDNQLNSAMNGVAQQNGLTFEQFRQILEDQDVYNLTREQLRKDIMLQQLQNGAVNSRIDITRQEVENYLRSEAGQATIAPEYRISQLLIEHGDGADGDRREELANFLYEQLRQGGEINDFIAAGQISGIPLRGSDMGFRKVENLPSIFQNVVPELTLGEISAPFTSESGWHIVQLKDLRGGANLEIQQFHVRHIQIEPNEIRTEGQAEALIDDLYERIQNGEDLGDLARQNTDDESSMVSGGDIDWVTFGQLPPDFMAAIQQLEIGEMSEPVRLQSGWHIIELLETRVEDVTDENMRYQAEQILRQRKYENELENWLTELRDTAYVDIKIEPENL